MSYQLASGESAQVGDDGQARPEAFDAIVGGSPALREAMELARRVAGSVGTNVLLVGETGTGKEIFARAVHYAGPRPDAPFVAVNCAAIPATLLESELFGYERGAFTDAKQKKRGLLELAAEGTLFLDEVSGLPLDLQPKLLRAIEERRVRRVGGFDEIEIRCRVVAATNEPLEDLVADGSFREDLFYRLNVFRINLPPLRVRSGDLVPLAEHFLQQLAEAQGLSPARLTPGAVSRLEAHDWPGNVRELKNVLERALVLSGGGAVEAGHLQLSRRAARENGPATPAEGVEDASVIRVPSGGRTLRSVEAELIRVTLELTGGNKSAAARILGISRPTLHKKVSRYGIGAGERT